MLALLDMVVWKVEVKLNVKSPVVFRVGQTML